MKASAYLYSLFDNKGIVRRDLPESKFAPQKAPGETSEEFNSREIKKIGEPKPQQPKLVSSCEGKINSMLLTIPLDSEDFAAIYKKLLETLPEYTSLVCLVNSGSKAMVENWLKTYKRDETSIVIEAPDSVGFSIWAQDAYALTTSNEQAYFVEPLSFLRYADAVIADYVTNATNIKNFQVPLYFQGGNILVGDDFWLIGADYPKKSLEYINNAIFANDGETSEQLVKRLFQENLDTSRELTYVGSPIPVPADDVMLTQENGQFFVDMVFQGNESGTVQPLFHIDMFLTLAGRDATGKYQILVGDPSMAPIHPSVNPPAVYSMQNVYDAIADFFKSSGFNVIRNPLPLTFSTEKVQLEKLNVPDYQPIYEIYLKLHNLGLTEIELRSWYFATANNALVENTASCKRVWLPTYGYEEYEYLQESDRKNQEIWQNLGFEVTMLPNFHSLASGLGAVHCIQKYIERG
jgi:hypothetical protein